MNKEIEVCDFRYDEGLRSRVEKQIMPCITCHSGGGYSGTPMVMEKVKIIGNYIPSKHEASRIIDSDGLAPTIKENHGTVNATNQNMRIRKLTSLECWRLMGFSDQDHFNAKQVNSETQLYKQAGNSIVVNVLMAIFKELLDD